jgi:hypothetical protein
VTFHLNKLSSLTPTVIISGGLSTSSANQTSASIADMVGNCAIASQTLLKTAKLDIRLALIEAFHNPRAVGAKSATFSGSDESGSIVSWSETRASRSARHRNEPIGSDPGNRLDGFRLPEPFDGQGSCVWLTLELTSQEGNGVCLGGAGTSRAAARRGAGGRCRCHGLPSKSENELRHLLCAAQHSGHTRGLAD